MNEEIKKACNHYVNVISQLQTDTGFLLDYNERLVEENLSEKYNFETKIPMYSGSFAVYDFPYNSINGRLAPNYEKHIDINSKNLNYHFNNFSNWIINLSFLRAYIMLEVLLLRAIQDAYFPTLSSPIYGRVEMNKLNPLCD